MDDTTALPAPEEPSYSVPVTANIVGVSPSTVRRWALRGLIDYRTTPTGRMFIPRSQIDKIHKICRATSGVGHQAG
jgi:predicted site-specific integrase-resolvase